MKIDETSVMSESISSVTEAVLVRGWGSRPYAPSITFRNRSLARTVPIRS